MQKINLILEKFLTIRLSKSIVLALLGFALFFLPLPFFLDLKTLNFHFKQISTLPLYYSLNIPMHLGTLTLLIILPIVMLSKSAINNLLKGCMPLLFLLALLNTIALFSDMSLIRCIQLSLFFLLAIMLYATQEKFKYTFLSIIYLASCFMFSLIHVSSIGYLSDWTFVDISPDTNWIGIFGYDIYSGLTTYHSVLMLIITLIIKKLFLSTSKKEFIFYFFFIGLLNYIAATSAQRSYIIFLILLFFYFGYLLINNNALSIYKISKKTLLFLMILLIFTGHALVSTTKGSPLDRMAYLVKKTINVTQLGNDSYQVKKIKNDLNLSRYKYFQYAIENIKSRIPTVLYRGDGRLLSGSHNYYLDLISGIGGIGLIVFIVLLFFTFKKMLIWSIDPLHYVLIGAALLESFYNEPLTQPFYVGNWLICFMLIGTIGVPKSNH